jgi:hypothetical protein
VRHLLQLISENVALFTVFYNEESDLPPKLRAQVLEVRQRNAAGLETIQREGIAQRVFREMDSRLIVHAMLGMCAWLHKWYQPEEERLEEVAAVFLGLIEKGCVAPRGAEAQDRLADRLRHLQDTLSLLAEHAEQLEKTRATL